MSGPALVCLVLASLLPSCSPARHESHPTTARAAAPRTADRATPAAPPSSSPNPAPPAPPATLATPTRHNAGAQSCVAREPSAIGDGPERLASVLIAFGPVGGLVVWPTSDEQVSAVPLGRDGTPNGPPRTFLIAAANRLYALQPSGDRFVLMTHSLDPASRFFHKRLVLLALGPTGEPLGAAATLDLDNWIGAHAFVDTADGLLHGISQTYAAPKLLRHAIQADGTVRTETLHEFPDSHDPTILIGADAQGWYALAEYSGLAQIATSAGTDAHTTLSEDARPYAVTRAPNGLAVVFRSEEGGGARAGVISLAGRLVGSLARLRPTDPLPPPWGDRVEAALRQVGPALVLTRRDVAGFAVGAPLSIPRPGVSRADPPQDVAWSGERFVVALGARVDGRWKIETVAVDCAP